MTGGRYSYGSPNAKGHDVVGTGGSRELGGCIGL